MPALADAPKKAPPPPTRDLRTRAGRGRLDEYHARAHGVSLSDAQLDDLIACARAWNEDRARIGEPALTLYQALGEMLRTARGLMCNEERPAKI